MRKLTIALALALVFGLLAGPALARPAKTIHCKGPGTCVGTDRAETIYGKRGYGNTGSKGGSDWIYTRGGSYENTHGGNGNGRIFGQGGIDYIQDERGNDHIWGGPRRDYINGEDGRDQIKGGGDNIRTKDGQNDRVDCGNGRDEVNADNRDVVKGNCEEVHRK